MRFVFIFVLYLFFFNKLSLSVNEMNRAHSHTHTNHRLFVCENGGRKHFSFFQNSQFKRNNELYECLRLIFLLWSFRHQKCLFKTWINKLNRVSHCFSHNFTIIIIRPSSPYLTSGSIVIPWKEPLQLDEFHFIPKKNRKFVSFAFRPRAHKNRYVF